MLVNRLHDSAAAAMLVEGEVCSDHPYKNLYGRQPQHGLLILHTSMSLQHTARDVSSVP